MTSNEALIKKLKNDICFIKEKVECTKIYKLKIYTIKNLTKCGIAINRTLPFILATIIAINTYPKNRNPLAKDDIEVKERVETMNTSSGIKYTKTSFDYKYNNKTFEHSTAWYKNELGLYERTITSYKYKELKNYNIDDVLLLSKDEIEKLFTITNIEKIEKETLDELDNIYNEDIITITTSSIDSNNIKVREQTTEENIIDIGISLAIFIFCTMALKGVGKIFIRKRVENKLTEINEKYKFISEEETKELKRILKIRQENLDLLTGTQDEFTEPKKENKLRKILYR